MKSNKVVATIFAIIASLACIISFAILAMHGNTTTTGQYPANVQGQSLICDSSTIDYPFFVYDGSRAKDLKITVGFYNGEPNSVSLSYTLYYDEATRIMASEAHNHAAMNISFSKNGLEVDALNAHYSEMEDYMRMRLYATNDQLTTNSAKYFLINLQNNKLPTSPSAYQEIYTAQGFSCQLNG